MRFKRQFGFLVLLAACGCSHAPTEPEGPALGERFPLRSGEAVSIRDEPVEISFDRIVQDSRCPIDVVCIVAGEARGAFRLSIGRAAPVAFELSTDRDSSVAVSGYRVTLHAVLPAPRSNVRIDPREYRAELTVSR